ncbi:MAG: hypothetical protein EA342_15055 [Leptolyngbya sp. LCM1.Bin17]|nr:MAG: hypothetical protein EA342_15055 [Leptolyngbya sp. LCM1.Bin17]
MVPSFSSDGLMYSPAIESLLFYKISSDSESTQLRIWEEYSSHADQSQSPYSYILNIQLTSAAEAQAYLRLHVALNGGILAADQNLPPKGKIALMPYPTWTGEEG